MKRSSEASGRSSVLPVFLLMCSRAALFSWVLLAILLPARPAEASELDDFQQAQTLYEAQQYTDAALLFERLVGGDAPHVLNRALLLESRKYLGTCYLFLGRRDDAEKQFELLLQDDESYELDPVAFPEEVQALFNAARRKLQNERRNAEQKQERAEQEARKRQAEKLESERKNLRRLVDLAETEIVRKENSRWIALIPFGVGQFQNGHPSLGAFLAISEGLMVALNVASYFLHQNLEGQTPAEDKLGEAKFAEKTFRITNQVTLGVFAVLCVAGMVDAQVRFKPYWTRKDHREIPDDLKKPFALGSGAQPFELVLRF